MTAVRAFSVHLLVMIAEPHFFAVTTRPKHNLFISLTVCPRFVNIYCSATKWENLFRGDYLLRFKSIFTITLCLYFVAGPADNLCLKFGHGGIIHQAGGFLLGELAKRICFWYNDPITIWWLWITSATS